VGPDLAGQESGKAGLSGSGRTPEQERRKMSAGDAASERSALADEMLLADELIEGPWPHPRRERLLLGRRLEERLGPGAGWSAG
jgi:hypothetical protein